MNAREIIRRHWIKALVIVLLLAGGYWYLSREGGVSMERITAYVRALPAGWFIAAFLFLPLAGVPISPFLILCGVRFGFAAGMGVAAAAILVHNFVAFHLVHGGLRRWMSERLTRKGHKIPSPKEKNQAWFTILFVGFQGPPYAVKLYLLALTEVPFRIYFWLGAPIYIFFGLIPVGAGSSAVAVNPLWAYAGVFAVMGLILLIRYLKKRISGRARDEGVAGGV